MGLLSVLNGRALRQDVQKLVEAFKAELKAGHIFEHDFIERVIAEKRTSHRYRTIINAAKRELLKETGYALESLHGVGYMVPTGVEQLRTGAHRHRLATRAIVRAATVMGAVSDDRLTDKECQERNAAVSKALYLVELGRITTKQIEMTIGKLPERTKRNGD